jgi:hypothetical protein
MIKALALSAVITVYSGVELAIANFMFMPGSEREIGLSVVTTERIGVLDFSKDHVGQLRGFFGCVGLDYEISIN